MDCSIRGSPSIAREFGSSVPELECSGQPSFVEESYELCSTSTHLTWKAHWEYLRMYILALLILCHRLMLSISGIRAPRHNRDTRPIRPKG